MYIKITHLFACFALVLSMSALADPLEQKTSLEQKALSIFKITSLAEINIAQPDQTLFLFDLDDTLFDFSYMVGSKAWRRYIVEATKKIDSSKNWHDFFSYLLAQKHPLKTVEPFTSQFVQELQEKGYIVCGLTSRERQQWYSTPQEGIDVLTTEQLASININFNKGRLEYIYPHLVRDSEYFSGIFFANLELKGNYLLHLFKNVVELPKKVIFIDDKLSQVESVAKALNELGIDNECYYYPATDEKAKGFNPLIANIQLYYFIQSNGLEILSDQEAALIVEEDLEKDAEHYLRAVLDLVYGL